MSAGQVMISREEQHELCMLGSAAAVVEALKAKGNLYVVEFKDGGWAIVDPAPPMYDHPVVEGGGVGFGNLQ